MWNRHKPHPPIPEVTPPQQTDGILAAKKAQNNARNSILDAVDSGVRSRSVVEAMRSMRATNHFGPTLDRALRSEKP